MYANVTRDGNLVPVLMNPAERKETYCHLPFGAASSATELRSHPVESLSESPNRQIDIPTVDRVWVSSSGRSGGAPPPPATSSPGAT